MPRIAVLTSGGDAPGMTAGIRAVVRTALARGWDAFGVPDGFAGLMSGRLIPLGARDVGGIVQRGGTMLRSARCPEFKEHAAQQRALEALAVQRVDALVVIGGNGSQADAQACTAQDSPSSASRRPSTTICMEPTSRSAWIRPSISRSRRSTGFEGRPHPAGGPFSSRSWVAIRGISR